MLYSMPDEQFEIYGEDGKLLGTAPRSQVHREGLWHRAANVFLFRSDGRLLIQRRQLTRDVWPGAWDLSVAEHLQPGESYERAALRGLHEELGVGNVQLTPVGGVSQSRVESSEPLIRDYELQQSFRAVFDGAVVPALAEVAEVRLVTVGELTAAIAREPGQFTPWFRQCAIGIGIDPRAPLAR
jgi:isopentenyl-diphosphate delta-isomerase type 1